MFLILKSYHCLHSINQLSTVRNVAQKKVNWYCVDGEDGKRGCGG